MLLFRSPVATSQTVFTPGAGATPTFSFESSAGDILVMRYGGIRVNTLEINAAFGEIVTASFGLEGTTRAKQGSTSSESYASILPFHFTGASVKIAGSEVGNVKNFNFNVGNNIERIGTLRKSLSWKRTALGNRDVGLSMTMDFTDTSDYDLFLAGTEFAVELHLEGDYITGSSGPKHTLRIEVPRVKWNMVNAPWGGWWSGSVSRWSPSNTWTIRRTAGTRSRRCAFWRAKPKAPGASTARSTTTIAKRRFCWSTAGGTTPI
jgi:hypothetical protein